MSSSAGVVVVPPDEEFWYTVLSNQQVSPDSHIIKVDFSATGRPYLGWDAQTPTCISVFKPKHAEQTTANDNDTKKKMKEKKSYSPISHPSCAKHFTLLVKKYPPAPDSPGVAAYLCSLSPNDTFCATVKSPRIIHGQANIVQNRSWKRIGLVGGGTGVAPLHQLLEIFLSSSPSTDNICVDVLAFHRHANNVLLQKELESICAAYPDRVRVTISLTGEDNTVEPPNEAGRVPGRCRWTTGRGSVELIREALPPPSNNEVMIFVCGTKEMVAAWGGPVGRDTPPAGKKKGKKIQGELLGVLKEAGYNAGQVFKY